LPSLTIAQVSLGNGGKFLLEVVASERLDRIKERNMIPNAVASTGPYAGLWSHLKSMDHALERALRITNTGKLTELDKDRLQALIEFLQGSLPTPPDSSEEADDLFFRRQTTEPDYSGAIDLQQEVHNVHAFEEWSKPSRKSFEINVRRLIKAIEEVLGESTSNTLLPGMRQKEIPRTEFEVLRAILQSLLAETETALY